MKTVVFSLDFLLGPRTDVLAQCGMAAPLFRYSLATASG
jgi:hypothetical protein